MSEIENSTAEIDNNVQEITKTPSKSTPSKRLSSFERARVEGEELLKALGGSLEGGRRTRSSTRGPSTTPSPQATTKRTRATTPRRVKKTKLENDEVDSGNNNQEENNKDETQVAEAADSSSAPQPTAESDKSEKSANADDNKKEVETVEPMEVDGGDKKNVATESVSDIKGVDESVAAESEPEKSASPSEATAPTETVDGKTGTGSVESADSSKVELSTVQQTTKTVDGASKNEEDNSVEAASNAVDSAKVVVQTPKPPSAPAAAEAVPAKDAPTSDPKPVENVLTNDSKEKAAIIKESVPVKLKNDVKTAAAPVTSPADDVPKVENSVACHEPQVTTAPSATTISESNATTV